MKLHLRAPLRSSLRLWALPLALGLIAGSVRAQELFPLPRFVSSDGAPRGIATGQFSSDGLFDVVTSNTVAGRIAVHRARLDGSFQVPVTVVVEGEVTAFETVDFDRDGLSDVGWVDEARGRVGVVFQLATTPTTYRVESIRGADEPVALQAWDENGDEWPDLLVAFQGADAIGVVTNEQGTLGTLRLVATGDGPVQVRPIPWPQPWGPRLGVVQPGWLSRDVGVIDLEGNFENHFALTGPTWLNVLDRDGDPWPDLAILDGQGGQVQEWNGNDQGGFALASTWDVEPRSERLELVDSTVGQRRWLVAESARLRIASYEENAGEVIRTGSWYVGSQLRDWAWADFDLDGSDELAVPLSSENGFAVLETRGGKLLAPEALDTGLNPESIVRCDDPASAHPAVAVLAPTGHEVWTYDVVANEVRLREVLPVDPGGQRQAWGDLDANGRSDLVVGIPGVGLDVVRRNADGSYAAPVRVALARSMRSLAILDVVGDGALDIVVASTSPSQLLLLEGDGSGGFAAPVALDVSQVPVRVRGRDLDLDGDTDVVVVGEESQVSLHFRDGAGFRPAVVFGVGDMPRDVGFGFFNGDAFPDIVVANGEDGTFSVLASLLAGVYTLSVNAELAPSGAENVLVGDFDGNGRDDVILSSPSSTTLSVHLNSSTGGSVVDFTLPLRRRFSALPFSAVLCEVDGDGVPDVLSVDLLGSILVVLRSDPESVLPPAQVALEARWMESAVRLEVEGDAAAADQFVVRRQRDGRAVRFEPSGPRRWLAVDRPPFGAAETYRLTRPDGASIESVRLGPEGFAAASASRAFVARSETRQGTSLVRFRVDGGTPPQVRVYDLRGRHVASLPAIPEGDDWYRAVWDGSDDRGRTTARGRYLVEVRTRAQSLRSSWLRP